ncbi:hypothetical protein LLG95_08710 [bacterium]|nr:hypothetical protein [bacterium]
MQRSEAEEAKHRAAICRQLGIPNIVKAHELIVEGAARGATWLKHLGFNAQNMADLGYPASNLARLGYNSNALKQLGFFVDEPAPAAKEPVAMACSPKDPELKRILERGGRASDIKRAGFTIIQCRHAGLSAMELAHLGFEIVDICSVCSAAEMRRADFKAMDLRNYFSDIELKNAGFSASEMRMSGYTVRDLLRLGYNENHIRTAGYSTGELIAEGLTKIVRTPPNHGTM